MSYTLVTFHAHPDDEAIATGGTMARAAAEGHRVVLVVATRGELGEYAPDALAPGETLAEHRVAEQLAAADALGIQRVEFLGYRDSGMDGEPTNTDEGAFAAADIEEAASRLAELLREEQADVITIYDDHGGYGHPDHVQVHRVGRRAAELAGTPRVYEATMDRDFIKALMRATPTTLPDTPDTPDAAQMDDFGSPSSMITTTRRRPRLRRSQASRDGGALEPDPRRFVLPRAAARSLSRGLRRGMVHPAPTRPTRRETWLFDGLDD